MAGHAVDLAAQLGDPPGVDHVGGGHVERVTVVPVGTTIW